MIEYLLLAVAIPIAIIALSLWFHFEPSLSKTEHGWIIWYNKYGRKNTERDFKELWK